jgi:23S rRNA U2552 (ribose-2'-O)-methylase RlmE/FtsJ
VGLWAEFLTNDGPVVHKWKHYFPAYERHLARFVNQPLVFWEIGCGKGGSLQMWRRFLGPHAQIVGIDIRPECRAFQGDQVAVRIGSQADTRFLDRVLAEFGTPHVVLDDGSHEMPHVVATFRHLYEKVDRNGLYIVEDMHASYWPEYGGGLREEGSFIELCKTLIDELNADWTRGALAATEFTRSTTSMHFYDSMVVIERGRLLKKSAPKVGRAEGEKEAKAE